VGGPNGLDGSGRPWTSAARFPNPVCCSCAPEALRAHHSLFCPGGNRVAPGDCQVQPASLPAARGGRAMTLASSALSFVRRARALPARDEADDLVARHEGILGDPARATAPRPWPPSPPRWVRALSTDDVRPSWLERPSCEPPRSLARPHVARRSRSCRAARSPGGGIHRDPPGPGALRRRPCSCEALRAQPEPGPQAGSASLAELDHDFMTDGFSQPYSSSSRLDADAGGRRRVAPSLATRTAASHRRDRLQRATRGSAGQANGIPGVDWR
jgi:hypothetical protein